MEIVEKAYQKACWNVKEVWKFAAQPSAQQTFDRLGSAPVVWPWSKNDNKAHFLSQFQYYL